MKRFNQLTNKQQERALQTSQYMILNNIIEGRIKFDEEDSLLQARIQAAINKAHRLETPWFAPSMVYEEAKIEVDAMTLVQVEEAFYPEPHELVLPTIIKPDDRMEALSVVGDELRH